MALTPPKNPDPRGRTDFFSRSRFSAHLVVESGTERGAVLSKGNRENPHKEAEDNTCVPTQ